MKRIALGILTAAFLASPLLPTTVSYASQSLTSNDPLRTEQWAFYNDGTFSVETEKNRYPVFDDPFGSPAGPGEWGGGNLIGFLVETATETAKAGIDINLQEGLSRYAGGKRDVIVAMIDTGVDYGHEDLQGSIWTNTDEIPDNGIDDDANGYVDDVYGWNFYNNSNAVYVGSEDSHGTHGAGTIAAVSGNGTGITGMASGSHVKVMIVKALGGKDGGGDTTSLIKAIRYAEDNGASICNLSLTSKTDDQALYQAIKNSNMLFVAASGNDGTSDPSYPAAYDLDNIISVANLSFDGELHKTSNYSGETVDLAAPGTQILSTTPGNSYGYMTGTSMAAPMVTGAAAMVYSYYDTISLADVKEILLNSVTPMSALAGKTVSGGMLNVGAALSYDTSALTHTGFLNCGRTESGAAPYLEAKSTDTIGGTYLTVRAIDIDGDLAKLCYAVGEHTAEEFESGLEIQEFQVNARGVARFLVSDHGIYTFYAKDGKGNTTVKTVEVAPVSLGPGARTT